MNRILKTLTIIILSFFSIAAANRDILSSEPVKVANNFLQAIIEGDMDDANEFLVKRLHNNNHWINASKKDRKEFFAKWVPSDFRKINSKFGYVIFSADYGNFAVKVEKEKGKWLWAHE